MNNNLRYSTKLDPHLSETSEILKQAEDIIFNQRQYLSSRDQDGELSKSGREYLKWLDTVFGQIADIRDEICNPPDEGCYTI